MPTLPLLPPRPDLSLLAILGYAFVAFVVGLALTPAFVSFLRRNRLGKQLRVETVDGREASVFRKYHEKKFGTPTMGGILIWGSIVITIILSRVLSLLGVVENSLLQRGQVYLPLFVLLSLGVLGAIDDYLNVIGNDEASWKKKVRSFRALFIVSFIALAGIVGWEFSARGLEALVKPHDLHPVVVLALYLLILTVLGSGIIVADDVAKQLRPKTAALQKKKGGLGVLPKITSLLAISTLAAVWFTFKNNYDSVALPFSGTFGWPEAVTLGLWYIPLFVFIVVGTANAVNVTDGLDGLAGGLLVIAFGGFSILAFLSGLSVLAAFCAVTAGAVAAFLWHNVPPAMFYMGDTGALALGGALGVVALMIDRVLLLPLIGFVFLIEMLSVLLQLTSKKLRGGKKIFRAAPIHHHFEALEWGESKVTMRFWIIGAFATFLGIVIGLYGF